MSQTSLVYYVYCFVWPTSPSPLRIGCANKARLDAGRLLPNVPIRRQAREAESPIGPIPVTLNTFACLDFVDSEFADHLGSGRRFDRLPNAEWQRFFLARWGWASPGPPSPTELRHLRELRSRLRLFLEAASQGRKSIRSEMRHLNKRLAAAPFVFTLKEGRRLGYEPLHRNWEWIMAELTRSAAEIVADFDPRRVQTCAKPHCRWVVYDETMKRSRPWCTTRRCGNLIKVREVPA